MDGTNPPASDQFKTYAGGPLTGAWQTSNMTRRVTPPVSGDTPQYIADYYYAQGHRHLERLRGLLRQRDRHLRQHSQIANPTRLGGRRFGGSSGGGGGWRPGHAFRLRRRLPEIP